MYTVVTGLFDIGRGEWRHYNRPIVVYLFYFLNILKLKAPMVVFCEERFVKFTRTIRRTIDFPTTVIPTRIEDLYMYKHKELLFDIQKDPEYGVGHPRPECPEISVPTYSLVVTSKLDLLFRGTEYATTEYCLWLDGGYTHGSIDVGSLDWNPSSLYSIKDKISMIALRPISDMVSDDPIKFSNQYIDIINGGFIGGYKNTIVEVHEKYYSIVEDLLVNHRMKEDDQYYWTFMAKRHPELMNLIRGNWYDAFNIP